MSGRGDDVLLALAAAAAELGVPVGTVWREGWGGAAPRILAGAVLKARGLMRSCDAASLLNLHPAQMAPTALARAGMTGDRLLAVAERMNDPALVPAPAFDGPMRAKPVRVERRDRSSPHEKSDHGRSTARGLAIARQLGLPAERAVRSSQTAKARPSTLPPDPAIVSEQRHEREFVAAKRRAGVSWFNIAKMTGKTVPYLQGLYGGARR